MFVMSGASELEWSIVLFHFNGAVSVVQSINFGMSDIMHGKNEYLYRSPESGVNLNACSCCLFKTYYNTQVRWPVVVAGGVKDEQPQCDGLSYPQGESVISSFCFNTPHKKCNTMVTMT